MAESALTTVDRLRAALDRAEEIARGASPGPWRLAIMFGTVFSDAAGHTVSGSRHLADADFIVANDPAHVLRTVAAHRKFLDHLESELRDDPTDEMAAEMIGWLAAVYFPEAPDGT